MMQEDDVQALRIAVERWSTPGSPAASVRPVFAGKPIELFNRVLPELFPRKLLVLNWRRQKPLFD